MVDFSKLKVRSAAKRAAEEKLRAAAKLAADRAKRIEFTKKTIIVTLRYDAESRFTTSGAMTISIHGTDTFDRPVRAVFYAPADFDHDATENVSARLTEGAEITLDGYWKKREYNGQSHFEFVTQFITIDDETFPSRN